MQTTGDALLQAILDEPEADDLRLIYADWLEDHGQPERAEFIRVQVTLSRPLPGCDRFLHSCSEILTSGRNRTTDLDRLAGEGCEPCKRWASLTLRQWRLLTPARFWEWFPEVGSAWPGSPAVVIDPTLMTCEVGYFAANERRWMFTLRRGFIHSVAAHLDAILAHLPDLLLRHPVQEVRVTDKRPMNYMADVEPHMTWWNHLLWDSQAFELADLPSAIWKRLRGHVVLTTPYLQNKDGRDYPAEADALAALSRAVLEECKWRAKLLEPSSA